MTDSLINNEMSVSFSFVEYKSRWELAFEKIVLVQIKNYGLFHLISKFELNNSNLMLSDYFPLVVENGSYLTRVQYISSILMHVEIDNSIENYYCQLLSIVKPICTALGINVCFIIIHTKMHCNI